MYETEVDWGGQVRKIFCAAGRANTRFISDACHTTGPHLTCDVTTLPYRKKLPQFFETAGKLAIRRWWEPLRCRSNRTRDIQEENGLMTKELLPAYVEHFAKHARIIARNMDLTLVLLLDVHKSKNWIEWIEQALKHNIEIVESPANTSHYLQVIDQKIYLILNKVGKSIRDALVQETDMTTTNTNFKFVKAVQWYIAINEDVVNTSWKKTRLWPTDFRFVQVTRDAWERHLRNRI